MSTTTVNLGMLPNNRGSYTSETWAQNPPTIYKDNIVEFNNSAYIYSPVSFSIDNPAASATNEPPYDAATPTVLNTGWYVFASGNNTFTTGEKVDNIGIDDEPTAGSDNLVKSGGVAGKISQLDQLLNLLNKGYLFRGVTNDPTFTPMSGTQKIFYFTTAPAVYENCGNINVTNNLEVIWRDSSWHHAPLLLSNTYTFCGVPTTNTSPISGNWLFYIAYNNTRSATTYTNFKDSDNNSLSVLPFELCIFRKTTDNYWKKLSLLQIWDAQKYINGVLNDIEDRSLAGSGAIIGKYINSSGVLTSSALYSVSPAISLAAGDSICVVGVGATTVSILASVNNGVYSKIKTYDSAGVVEAHTFRAESNIDIVVSYRNDKESSAFVYKYSDEIQSLFVSNNELKSIVSDEKEYMGLLKTQGFSVAVNNRYLRAADGNVVTYDSTPWEITTPIELKAGEEIVITSKGSDSVCMLGVVYDETTNNVFPLVVGDSSVNLYRYIAISDCKIRCSLNKTTTSGPVVKVYSPSAIIPLAKNIEIENTQEYVNRIDGNKNLYSAHWGGNILGENNTSGFTIPTHSIIGMALAKRAGFNVLGINVALTSDGVAVCIHDSTINGTMRNKSDYSVISSPVSVSSITYAELVNNYVMQSTIERYRTQILSFEDAVKTAKALEMNIYLRPANASTYTEADRILRKYGMTDYILAEGNARKTNKRQLVAHYVTDAKSDAESVLKLMLKIGAPAIYFMEGNVIETYYENGILADVINVLHKNGFLVGVSPYAEPIWQFIAEQLGGFDFTSADNHIPPFENGDLFSGEIGLNPTDFSGTTTKELSVGQTVSKSGVSLSDEKIHIYKATLKLKIKGQFKVSFGKGYNGNKTFESDGEVVSIFTNVFYNTSADFEIEASSACTIDMLSYDVSVII